MPMTSTLDQLTLYRGIYSRVARRLGVDPSYVSRVARGDRSSQAVQDALALEIQKIDAKHKTKKNGIKVKRGRA